MRSLILSCTMLSFGTTFAMTAFEEFTLRSDGSEQLIECLQRAGVGSTGQPDQRYSQINVEKLRCEKGFTKKKPSHCVLTQGETSIKVSRKLSKAIVDILFEYLWVVGNENYHLMIGKLMIKDVRCWWTENNFPRFDDVGIAECTIKFYKFHAF